VLNKPKSKVSKIEMTLMQNIFSRMTYTDANNKRFIKLNLIHFHPERGKEKASVTFWLLETKLETSYC